MSRLGGITYGRVVEGLELPRPDWIETLKTDPETKRFAVPKAEGQ
jgi:hypothetical protein